MKEITVFICENPIVMREIIEKYFHSQAVTFAQITSEANREKIIKLLDTVE